MAKSSLGSEWQWFPMKVKQLKVGEAIEGRGSIDGKAKGIWQMLLERRQEWNEGRQNIHQSERNERRDRGDEGRQWGRGAMWEEGGGTIGLEGVEKRCERRERM